MDAENTNLMKKGAIKLIRVIRTPHSEQYYVRMDEESLGQLDVHYQNETHATFILLSKDMSTDDIALLLKKIEESLVKEDANSKSFVVTVYKAEDIGDKISEHIKSLEVCNR